MGERKRRSLEIFCRRANLGKVVYENGRVEMEMEMEEVGCGGGERTFSTGSRVTGRSKWPLGTRKRRKGGANTVVRMVGNGIQNPTHIIHHPLRLNRDEILSHRSRVRTTHVSNVTRPPHSPKW